MKKKKMIACFLLACLCLGGCAEEEKDRISGNKLSAWEKEAQLDDELTAEELYQRAKEEDTLIIYSVTSRAFDVKKAFEKEYPGLTVTIKDMRGDDVVDMLKDNYEREEYACDLVICSDCNGSLYKELLEPKIAYVYVPWDIASKLKDGATEDGLDFMGETMMLFYNETKFDSAPIRNIWELTEESCRGKIIMANPLKSFSTFEFCAALNAESKMLEEAYEEYFHSSPEVSKDHPIGNLFWEMTAQNIVFTNSSDEVVEGIGSGDDSAYEIGIMLSSKLRYRELGYHITPIYELAPFAAVYTPNCVTIAGGAKNINSAKLFIRYMMGETEGDKEGRLPFSTVGTWSTRTDVPDGNKIPLSEVNVIYPDKEYIYDSRDEHILFWEKLLEENVVL